MIIDFNTANTESTM